MILGPISREGGASARGHVSRPQGGLCPDKPASCPSGPHVAMMAAAPCRAQSSARWPFAGAGQVLAGKWLLGVWADAGIAEILLFWDFVFSTPPRSHGASLTVRGRGAAFLKTWAFTVPAMGSLPLWDSTSEAGVVYQLQKELGCPARARSAPRTLSLWARLFLPPPPPPPSTGARLGAWWARQRLWRHKGPELLLVSQRLWARGVTPPSPSRLLCRRGHGSFLWGLS